MRLSVASPTGDKVHVAHMRATIPAETRRRRGHPRQKAPARSWGGFQLQGVHGQLCFACLIF
jgi:hypothetical protein